MSLTINQLEQHLDWLAEHRGMPGVPEYAYVEVGRYKPYHPSIVKSAERRGYRVEKLGQFTYAIYPTLPEQAGEHEFQVTLCEADGTATVDFVRATDADAAELICRGRYPCCQIAETIPA